jgi:hypothetical protein
MARGSWVYVGGRAGNKPSADEKSVITAACEKFIADVLKPRFLPEIRPTKFNYPIAIYGKWHGNKYRFITRFRSDDPRSYGPFEAPFARLEYVNRTVSTCPTTGIRANGSASFNVSRSRKLWT